MIEKLPALSSIDARIVMHDQYEMRYGVFNHLAAHKDPLSSVAMHPCEDTFTDSKLAELCEEYALLNYHEMWGLSLDEFLRRPTYEVQMLREISERVSKKRAAAVDLTAGKK